MRFPILGAAALAAVAFLSPAVRTQVHVFGGADPDRKASSVFLAEGQDPESFQMRGGVSIDYSAPEWQDSYDAQLDSGKFNGTNQRLGKNWWTSFDTYSPLEIGGTKVAPGAYYLGIHVDQAGKFWLLFLDSKQVLANRWVPFVPEPWKTDVKAPLTLAKSSLDQVVKKMEIEITADEQDPANGKLSIRWGKHELSAPVSYPVGGPADAAAKKGTEK